MVGLKIRNGKPIELRGSTVYTASPRMRDYVWETLIQELGENNLVM